VKTKELRRRKNVRNRKYLELIFPSDLPELTATKLKELRITEEAIKNNFLKDFEVEIELQGIKY